MFPWGTKYLLQVKKGTYELCFAERYPLERYSEWLATGSLRPAVCDPKHTQKSISYKFNEYIYNYIIMSIIINRIMAVIVVIIIIIIINC